MYKKNILIFLSLILLAVMLQGCLSVETKEYSFSLKKDKSGKGIIKYINLMSDKKDSTSTMEGDYQDLLDNYIKGSKIEEELHGVKNVKKRLFEEDNQLCAEITFEFDDITKLKFYKYKETGPWCYYLGFTPMGLMGGSEAYFSSNGTYGGETVPIIFWDGDEKEFQFKTSANPPSKTTTSLLETWKQKGEN